jgi:hypothetical protein
MRALAWALILATAITLGSSVAASAGTEQSNRQPVLMVQGRIVDLRPGWLMLSDGTQIIVSEEVARWSELSLGVMVRVQFAEHDGRKLATSVNYLEACR